MRYRILKKVNIKCIIWNYVPWPIYHDFYYHAHQTNNTTNNKKIKTAKKYIIFYEFKNLWNAVLRGGFGGSSFLI